MLKSILALLVLFSFNQAQAAYCDGADSMVNNRLVFAEVVSSRSHLSMDLVVVSKQASYYTARAKIKGGMDYSPQNVPACDAEQNTMVNWLSANIASHVTESYDSWQATYRICLYDIIGNLRASYIVCNYNTGD